MSIPYCGPAMSASTPAMPTRLSTAASMGTSCDISWKNVCHHRSGGPFTATAISGFTRCSSSASICSAPPSPTVMTHDVSPSGRARSSVMVGTSAALTMAIS